jgi:hypothetical protein
MTRTGALREVWHPHTAHDREVVLRELADVLASTHFCNSKRYPALLKYIVEKTLAGEADQLKERTVGIEVFDRPADYDTNADTVVRYTAGEVRKRLSLYYHELDRRPAVQISLPAGSYVPEFAVAHEVEADGFPAAHSGIAVREPEFPALDSHGPPHGRLLSYTDAARPRRRWSWLLVAVLLVAAALAGAWRYRTLHPRTALEDFWAPLREQSPVMVCIGGSVFDQSHLSVVSTAGKDTDYPFVSLQSASALAQLSTLLGQQGGVTTEVRAAANTPLTDLREHPLVLIGGYNNQWTTRLLQPLRIHFVPVTVAEGIVDSSQAASPWVRDLSSQAYSDADDYALVARFRDPTTDSWVMALAGVGRNGTEAAAHFATSPHYIQQLRDRIGDFGNRNVEVVLKTSVVDGKTGAPTVQDVAVW